MPIAENPSAMKRILLNCVPFVLVIFAISFWLLGKSPDKGIRTQEVLSSDQVKVVVSYKTAQINRFVHHQLSTYQKLVFQTQRIVERPLNQIGIISHLQTPGAISASLYGDGRRTPTFDDLSRAASLILSGSERVVAFNSALRVRGKDKSLVDSAVIEYARQDIVYADAQSIQVAVRERNIIFGNIDLDEDLASIHAIGWRDVPIQARDAILKNASF